MCDVSEVNPAPSSAQSRGRFPLRLVLFGIVAVEAVACGFLLPSVTQARDLIQHYGYYGMAFTFAWAVLALVRIGPAWWRSLPWPSKTEAWTVAGTVLGLTLIAVLTVPHNYKVLYDEYVLQATAWCLHEVREVGAIVRGYNVEGVFSPLLTYLDKRPFFFAFIVSLLHDVTGYREANAFFLNTALMPVAIGLVYLLARRLTGHWSALAATLAFGALPLLAENATGAGMEMLNIVMLLVVVHLAKHYLEAPDEPRLAAFLLCTVLLAQTRYESSLYVLPAALVVVAGWRRRGELILPAAAVLAPALLIPYALHNTYLSGSPMLWELRPGETTRFGAGYLMENLNHALRFFFDFSGVFNNSWWLGVAGLPAILWTLWYIVKRWRQWRMTPPLGIILLIFGAAITSNLILLMFYYWGQLDDPIVSRLSLPFSALLALCIAWTVEHLTKRWRREMAWLAMGGAMLAYLSTGLVANASHWEMNLQAREIAWKVDTVQRMGPGERLVITNKSALIWLINKVPCIQIVRARVRGEAIQYQLDQHTFAEVLVMQTYRPVGPEGGFQLNPEDRLPDSFVLEPVIERRFGINLVRISRIVKVQPAPPKEGTAS